MKYLKKYENDNQNEFWLVAVEFANEPEANYHELFKDRESSDNFIIVKVNEFRQETAERKDEIFTNNDIFLTIEEAEDWLDENWDMRIYSYKIECCDKFELPKEYKLLMDTRKYNI